MNKKQDNETSKKFSEKVNEAFSKIGRKNVELELLVKDYKFDISHDIAKNKNFEVLKYTEYTNYFYPDGIRKTVYKDGKEETVTKQLLAKYNFGRSLVYTAKKEEKVDNSHRILEEPLSSRSIKRWRLKHLHSLEREGKWVIDYSIVDDKTVEIEVEYSSPHNISERDLFSGISVIKNIIFDIDTNFFDHREIFIEVLRLLKIQVADQDSIKGISPVVTLNLDLWKQLKFNTQDLYITDKVDGQRKLLYCDGSLLYIIDNKTNLKVIKFPFNYRFVFDTEVVDNTIFYLFDIYFIEHSRYTKRTLDTTFTFDTILKQMDKFIREYNTMRNSYPGRYEISFATKKFTNLAGDYFTKLTKILKDTTKKPYETDGYILYDRKTDTSYKYKRDNTIDFYMKRTENESNSYILHCGISKKHVHQFKIPDHLIHNSPVNYNSKTRSLSYMPFISALDTSQKVSYVTLTDTTDYDGKIGEFSYDTTIKKWKLMKIRYDRIITPTYYGNYYTTAESNFVATHNPFSLIDKDTDTYFNESNKDKHRNIRTFTNRVIKEQLYDKYRTSKILDLACGKGQDIHRYQNGEYVLGIDYDMRALEEFVSRRLKKTDLDRFVILKQLDLTQSYLDNIQELKDSHELPEGSFNSAFCNLAIHYFLKSKETFNNFLSFASHFLETGSKFIIICFDGEKILDLLRNLNYKEKYKIGEEFEIGRLYKMYYETRPYGNTISVKLPFSGDESYNEYIFIDEHHKDLFEQNRFKKLESNNFEEYFTYDNTQNMSDYDKEYLKLFHVLIYEKF